MNYSSLYITLQRLRFFALFCCLLLLALLQSGCGSVAAAPSPSVSALEVAGAAPAAATTTLEATAAPTAVPTLTPTPAPSATPDTRPSLDRTTNILILGSDRRPDTPNWRTDVMMVVALDLERNLAGVISIPRDVFLESIPNHQPNRINVVDYLGETDEPDGGGPKLLREILQARIGIPIHYYLRFNFTSFRDVVDALGGVDVDVKCAYSDYFPEEDVTLDVGPGIHHFTGAEALAYVRTRRQGGDLDRARRQQQFVWALRNQIRDANLLARVPALYSALADSIQTDVGLVTAIRLVRFSLALEEKNVHGLVVAPPTLVREGWRYGMSVFIPDWPAIATATQKLFELPPFTETNAPQWCP